MNRTGQLHRGKIASRLKPFFKIKVLTAVVLLSMLTVSMMPVQAVSNLQEASTLTFNAEADARVQESNPTSNYGTANYLIVDGMNNSDVESFMRFTVSGAAATIQSARLRVYVTTNASANGPAVYSANSTWTETGITWNNRPARMGNVLDNKGSVRKSTWVEYNVSAAVTGNGTYTFVLAADSSDAVRLSSREGSRAPQLVIAFNSSTSTATLTQTSTATSTSTITPSPTTTQTSTATHTSTATSSLVTSTDTAVTAPPTAVSQTFTAGPSPTETVPQTQTETLTPTVTYTNSPVPVTRTFSFTPVADAYADAGNPSTNYGASTTLRVDASPIAQSYLRFTVQGLTGTVTRATLRIFANSSSTTGYEVRSVSNNTWAETTITYNNAPTVGNILGTSGSFASATWTSVDITDYITGNGTYNVGLTTPSTTSKSLASREVGNNAPQLIIETQGGATNTPTPTRTATPPDQPTDTPTDPSSAVLVGAGDITSCSRSQDDQTAQLLDNIPGTVFTAGDNAYTDGTYTQFINCYDPTWGRHKSRTKPSPGNHEYLTSGAAGYFQYFNNIPSYYAYDLGAWRIYALNSEISVAATSAQVTWLQNDLATNPRQCVLAYWHKPRWSSGANHGDNSAIQTLWQTLYNAGAELVINGHEHHYERFAEMNASGVGVSSGLREIVAGTGGAALYPFGTPLAASEVRNNTAYGVLKLTLRPTGYDWQFIGIPGTTFTDSGSGNCH